MSGRTLSLAVLVLFSTAIFKVEAATFTVTTAADAGAGSLRQAIIDANANAGPDVIDFSIAPAGEKTIALANASGALPAITDPLTIDGTTQPGFSNKPVIELNGASVLTAVDGLKITTSNCVVRGLVINRFRSDGIEINGGDNNVVEGCIIGLNLAGTSVSANSLSGVFISNSSSNRIGGATAAARNIISGNGQDGVRIEGPASVGNVVAGNYIGTDLDGLLDFGNAADGIQINSAGNNRIGGVGKGNLISGNNSDGIEITGATATNNYVEANLIGVNASGAAALANSTHGVHVTENASWNTVGGSIATQGNTIAFNSQDAVYFASGTNNTIRANSTFSNGGLGIDLGPDGVTANDVGDADGGANHGQNFPVLTSAIVSATETTVRGILNSAATAAYAIDVYALSAPDAGSANQGQQYLGSFFVVTDAEGNTAFDVTLPAAASGRYLTATATDEWGNTSEFAANINVATTVAGATFTFTVTTTADSGAGSLRQAILDANANFTSGDQIGFAIPGDGRTRSRSRALCRQLRMKYGSMVTVNRVRS